MVKWLTQAWACDVPISGPMLKESALKLAKELGMETQFKCSDGWLDHFKSRHHVTFRVISGEATAAPKEAMDEWRQTLPQLLEPYHPRDVFNADETGLFFQLLPDATYTFKGDTCHGSKRSKQRLSVMVATNMDGSEKLPLLVIGKSANPHCFKNVKRLPVTY